MLHPRLATLLAAVSLEGATNAEGYFNMPFLPLGVYDVTAEAQGFQKVVKTGVSVELNKNTVSNFKLEISSVGAEVRITSEAPQIERSASIRSISVIRVQ
ncbi:MAG TPA: carboxypeptidase-like regulatory domain-containing protein [Blastocatellia bacterium]|nr:carboxypeptidase-like regulatory domain-containing protein [Blastocatellia bacterium]